MKTFTEIDAGTLNEVNGGMPSENTSFFYDLTWWGGLVAGAIADGARAYSLGASQGGYTYAKVGYR
jgi:hypothetical protein